MTKERAEAVVRALTRDGYKTELGQTRDESGDVLGYIVMVHDCEPWVVTTPGQQTRLYVVPVPNHQDLNDLTEEGSIGHRLAVITERFEDQIRIANDLLAELKVMGR